MRWKFKLVAAAVAFIMVTIAFQPAVARMYEEEDDSRSTPIEEVPGYFTEFEKLVRRLIDATTDMTDTDGDTIPDTVEWVIGTDAENNDTDYDTLDDWQEVTNQTDPNSPDSNEDGISDLIEVTGGAEDADGDGLPNAWDRDNDGDGLQDDLDWSPFARTFPASDVHMDLSTNGEHTFVQFQLRTSNPDHMRLVHQVWDWPDDDKGMMKDLDGSTEDLVATPMLVLEGDDIPSGPEMDDYGIMVMGDTAYLPLYPVWQYGNIVALKAQMYYPPTTGPQDLSLNVSMRWKVSGNTDRTMMSLRAFDGGSIYADGESPVRTSQGGGDKTRYEWTDLGNGYVSLKAANGLYLSLQDDDTVTASSPRMGNDERFKVETILDGRIALRANNSRYVTVREQGHIRADSPMYVPECFYQKNFLGFKPVSITLAVYPDEFYLTGCVVEEAHGFDAGIVYTDQEPMYTVRTNLYLAYEYLRNGTNNLTDIPQMMTDNGWPMITNVSSFEHKAEGFKVVSEGMLADAKDDFHPDRMTPVIIATQSRSITAEMSGMGGDGYDVGRSLGVDLTAMPVVVSKGIKMVWYNRTDSEPVELTHVVDTVHSWDLEDDEMSVLTGLIMAWTYGEERVSQVGPTFTKFDYDEHRDVISSLISGTDTLVSVAKGLRMVLKVGKTVYSWLKFITSEPLFVGAGQSALKVLKMMWDSVGQVKNGFWGVVNKAGPVLLVIGIIIDIGIALYQFFVISQAYDWSIFGMFTAALYAGLTLAWAMFLTFLGLLVFIPKVGWIFALIAIILAFSDTLVGWIFGKGWVQMVIELIIDIFTDIRTPIELDLQMRSSDIDIEDKDGNGLDVGDRITYRQTQIGWVNTSRDGEFAAVETGFIEPFISIWAPWKTQSQTGNDTRNVRRHSDLRYYKGIEYESEAWVEPGMPMVNFPVNMRFGSDYEVMYEQCILFGLHCDRKTARGSVTSDTTTLYFDVMPASITGLMNWRGISSQDHDGDGLNNTEENRSDPWKWDTDGDGLGDPFELTIGTDPRVADTDGDGLNDKEEHVLGLDPHVEDSDGDSIRDFEETRGWLVKFDYGGKRFNLHAYPDPRLNDTDGDGLNDHWELITRQNPASVDTDGDGVIDTYRDYAVTSFALNRKFGDTTGYVKDVAVDPDGFVYATVTKYLQPGHVAKIAPNGTVVDRWTFGGRLWEPNGITIDDEDNLWAVNRDSGSSYPDRVLKFGTNGTLLDAWQYDNLNSLLIQPEFITVDGDGFVYVTDWEMDQVQKFDANGTHIISWGSSGTGDGQFGEPEGIVADDDGHVYVVDQYLDRVQKFDTDGNYLIQWGRTGRQEGYFDRPHDIAIDKEGDLLVTEDPYESDYQRVQKFDAAGAYIANATLNETGQPFYGSCFGLTVTDDTVLVTDYEEPGGITELDHILTLIKVGPVDDVPDKDGDGLANDEEEAGWDITVTDATGANVRHVASDPLMADTDLDLLNDSEERDLGTDPASLDTDGDGLSDNKEVFMGTNASNWDTDGDGLDDGTEVTYGSDPLKADTDGEGVPDGVEFGLGSDPGSSDTDRDGLDDSLEISFLSDIRDPDPDEDFSFDGREYEVGTSPDVRDHDGDGLDDGLEDVLRTDARNADTDGDDLPDGVEVSMFINPLSNDTDGDGVIDSVELAVGMNPKSGDSDGDGVPDGLDRDHELLLDGTVYVCVDDGSDPAGLVDELADMADVRVVTPEELLDRHRDARYVVLIGDPASSEGTAGAVISDLLEDTPYIRDRMGTTEEAHMAVRYGAWTRVQTIVMLSSTYPSDQYRVIGTLKSMRVQVTEGALSFEHLAPRACFSMDGVDTVLATDAAVYAKLDGMLTFTTSISAFDQGSAPHRLTAGSGLAPGEVPVGRYVQVEVSDDVQDDGMDHIEYAVVWMYYSLEDLDRTGDGDADDPLDIDETTLSIYVHEGAGKGWTRPATSMDWVNEVGINTTDTEVFGISYAGYLWLNITHLSLFSMGGKVSSGVETEAVPGDDISALVGEEVTLDGSGSEGIGGVARYRWTFTHQYRNVTLHGETPVFTFGAAGEYIVTLTVIDAFGGLDTATLTVTVTSPVVDVRVGPVVDGGAGTTFNGSVPVRDALVRVTWGDEVHADRTDFSGFAYLALPVDAVGKEVAVRITAEGFEPQEYTTTFSADGTMDRQPGPMVGSEVAPPPEREAEGPAGWEWAIVVLAMVLTLLALLILTRGRPTVAKGGEKDQAK